jgi:hypothetical protein
LGVAAIRKTSAVCRSDEALVKIQKCKIREFEIEARGLQQEAKTATA